MYKVIYFTLSVIKSPIRNFGFTNPQLAFNVQSNARNTVMYPSNCNHKSHGDITQTAILLIKEMKRIMSVIGLPFYDHL